MKSLKLMVLLVFINLVTGIAQASSELPTIPISQYFSNRQLRPVKRVGVFPGTLDPVHGNHHAVVMNAIKQFNLDIVYVVPNPQSPHKPDATPYEVRKYMASLAFRKNYRIYMADHQMAHTFRMPQGAMKLMELLMNRHRGAQIFHIMGSDAVERYGNRMEQSLRLNRQFLELGERYHLVINIREPGDEALIPNRYGFIKVSPLLVQIEPLSSTEIREAFREGETPRGLNPRVAEFIFERGLYGAKRKASSCKKALSDENL